MARLADAPGEHTDRVVIDNTGLKGVYDFRLDWARQRPFALPGRARFVSYFVIESA
jgi:uncharacterized protein (TIGR03435 family)